MGRKVLGLEISCKEIKTALVKNGGHPQLLYGGVTPASFLRGDGLADDDGEIASAILAINEILSKEKKLAGVEAIALCVNDPQMVVRPVKLPALPPKEQQTAVEYELSQSFPGIAKSHVIAFKEYTRTKNEVTGIVSFAPKRNLESYRKLIEQLPFKGAYIDVVSNSDEKAFRFFGAPAVKDELHLVCDIKEASSHFTVFRNGRIVQSRQIPEGIRQMRETAGRVLNIDQAGYDALCSADPSNADIHNVDISAVTGAVYGNIEEQLRQTIEFYSTESGSVQNLKIFLTGSGSIFPKLDGYFEAGLGFPTAKLKPAAGLKADPVLFTKIFTVIGAAVRED